MKVLGRNRDPSGIQKEKPTVRNRFWNPFRAVQILARKACPHVAQQRDTCSHSIVFKKKNKVLWKNRGFKKVSEQISFIYSAT